MMLSYIPKTNLSDLKPSRTNLNNLNNVKKYFKEGERVLYFLKNSKDFVKWIPVTICKKLNNCIYEIKIENDDTFLIKRVHLNHLKKYVQSDFFYKNISNYDRLNNKNSSNIRTISAPQTQCNKKSESVPLRFSTRIKKNIERLTYFKRRK